jgi:hypothetical protein
MNKQELLEKVMAKKEFSQLPKRDVELALEKFENKNLNDYQKFKLTRQFLRKIFSGFSSRKVFSSEGKSSEWYLMKHKSSKERFSNYGKIYSICLKGFDKASVIDLGAGINGLSYEFFKKTGVKVDYVAVEALGQFVDLMNSFFKKEKFSAKAYHASLFDLPKIKEIIEKQKNPRVVFLFKVVDALEIVERNYSKQFLKEISGFSDRVVVSFATKSLGSRKKFGAQRTWLLRFIQENFKILEDFEIEGERYISFQNKSL